MARLVRPRREQVVFDRAIAQGDLGPGAPIDAALDLLHGALYHRLLRGHAPLTDQFVTQVIDLTVDGLHAPTDSDTGPAEREVRRRSQ